MVKSSGIYDDDGSMRVTVVGNIDTPATPNDTFTRPANTTAYVIGQLVANSTTAGSVLPLTLAVTKAGGDFVLRKVKLKKSNTSTTNAAFRVHFYESVPSCANGDGAAWSTNDSAYLGSCDVTMDRSFTDAAVGFGIPAVGYEITRRLTSPGTNIYALIEARAAYTPVSGEIFTVFVEILGN